MDLPEVTRIWQLFREVAPSGYWRRLDSRSGFQKRGIFCLRLVVWMMITQRLQPGGTLATTVQQLQGGSFRRLLKRCKRVSEGRISAATGGYCQARQKLSKLVTSQIVDELFERLQAVLREGWPGLQRPVFLLDGTALLLEHSPELKTAYPPARNQHGQSHWPVLRVAVAHDVESGLSVRPSWGAACGAQATSEQKLAEEVIERLPPGAVVLADRNFGIFSVAWVAHRQQHPVLFRLTNARARKLLGRSLEPGIDAAVIWKPSREDRRAHPALPADLALAGRVIVCELKGTRDPLLCLFTSLTQPADQMIQMYGLRWNIETDLRSLKRTVRLHHISVRSLDMMEKDLFVAILAYNLVRTVMCLAARKAGLSPRQLSFTSVYTLVELHLPALLSARSHKRWRCEMDKLVEYATAYKLPRRRKQRSYPRAVWGSGYRFPTRKPHDKTT
jgi:putative transposase